MSRISKITEPPHKPDRVWIFIDGKYCASLRRRTFQGMGLKVNDEITCEELKEKENFHWKQAYGEEAWKKEKVRLDAVKQLIENIDENISVHVVGFGADSTEMIEEHPEEKGKPDLDIEKKDTPGAVLIKAEVTGTERLRGEGYWVRPDKIEYAENHPDEDVWIILHYAEPEEQFVFIKPIPGKKYKTEDKEIRDSGEVYCIFNEGDEEVKSREEFSEYIKQKLK
jgi:hypothetical protein